MVTLRMTVSEIFWNEKLETTYNNIVTKCSTNGFVPIEIDQAQNLIGNKLISKKILKQDEWKCILVFGPEFVEKYFDIKLEFYKNGTGLEDAICVKGKLNHALSPYFKKWGNISIDLGKQNFYYKKNSLTTENKRELILSLYILPISLLIANYIVGYMYAFDKLALNTAILVFTIPIIIICNSLIFHYRLKNVHECLKSALEHKE